MRVMCLMLITALGCGAAYKKVKVSHVRASSDLWRDFTWNAAGC